MTIEVIKKFEHSCNTSQKSQLQEQELRELTVELMQKKGINPSDISIDNNGNVQITDLSNLKLHTIMLELEKLGLKMKYTNKTMIEIY